MLVGVVVTVFGIAIVVLNVAGLVQAENGVVMGVLVIVAGLGNVALALLTRAKAGGKKSAPPSSD
jgi:hypothetical protein